MSNDQSVHQNLLGHLLGGDEDDGSNQDTKSTSSDAEDEQTQAQQLLGQLLSSDTNTKTEQKQKIIRIVECWTAMAGNERKAMVAEIYGKAFDKKGNLNKSFPYPITYNDKTQKLRAGGVLRRLILWITDYPAAAEQLDLTAMYNLSNSKLSGTNKKKVLDKMNETLEQNRIKTNKKNMEQVNDALNTYGRSKQPLSQRLLGYMLSKKASSNDTNTQGQENIELREELDHLVVKFANSNNDEDIESDMERAKQIFAMMDIGSSNVSDNSIVPSTTNYMANQTFAQLFNPPGQEYTNMKISKIYHRTKKYLVLKDLIGVEGQLPPRDHPVWNEAVKLIMKNSQADDKAVDEINAEQLQGWWSDESNHKHPFDQGIRKMVGLNEGNFKSEDATLNELIEVMNDNKEFMMKMCPWMREEPSLAVSYLPSLVTDKTASWWFDQIPNNKKKNALRTISINIINAGKSVKEREGRNTDILMNQVAISQEIVAILQLESGLVVNRNEYQAAVYKWLKSDVNKQADQVLFNNHLMKSFFDWAGVADLSKWGGFNKYADVVNFKQANEMFNKYLGDETVKKFVKEMERLAEAEVNLINKALEKLPTISEHYNNKRNVKHDEPGYNMRVYIGEKADRAADPTLNPPSRTVRLPSGKEVEVPSYEELNYPFFHELHHVGPEGRKKKLEARWPNNEVKQPAKYNKEDMEKQGPFMDMESKYYHRLVDLVAIEDYAINIGIRRELIKNLQYQLALKYNNNQCIVNSDHTANVYNVPAFDLHHLAIAYNLQIGSTVLVTKKVSNPSQIKQNAKSHYDLIENLFPELIITRLIDCRYHGLFHYLLDNPDLMEDLELVFPYNFDKDKMIMYYTGEDEDIDDDDEGSEEPLELPSVMKVLNQEWKGVSRRTL